MRHLPRPLADLICLWRGLLTQPREVLLNRNHHQWTGAGAIALIAVLVATGAVREGALVPIGFLAGPGFLLDLAGSVVHGLWQSGRIWQDLECECCGGPGGDGDDDDFEDPDDGGGDLARDVEDWLKNQPSPTR